MHCEARVYSNVGPHTQRGKGLFYQVGERSRESITNIHNYDLCKGQKGEGPVGLLAYNPLHMIF